MLIRPEAPGEEDAIRALTAEAFAGAEHSDGTEAGIIGALRDDGALTVSLVAVEDDAIVGHVAFSPVGIDGAEGWFGLGPISVRPDRQGRGIGSALVRAGIDELRALNASGCVLLGSPAYYGRFGFQSDRALTYGGSPSPYFQRLVLKGPAPRGEVSYHPAFGG
jgi:predicted N-acetyltransferase YhbS